jgi:hypothetical protein
MMKKLAISCLLTCLLVANAAAAISVGQLRCEQLEHPEGTESARPASQSEGVEFLRQKNDRVVFRVGSGNYVFVSKTK